MAKEKAARMNDTNRFTLWMKIAEDYKGKKIADITIDEALEKYREMFDFVVPKQSLQKGFKMIGCKFKPRPRGYREELEKKKAAATGGQDLLAVEKAVSELQGIVDQLQTRAGESGEAGVSLDDLKPQLEALEKRLKKDILGIQEYVLENDTELTKRINTITARVVKVEATVGKAGSKGLTELTERVDKIVQQIANFSAGVDGVRGRFTGVEHRLMKLEGKAEGVDGLAGDVKRLVGLSKEIAAIKELAEGMGKPVEGDVKAADINKLNKRLNLVDTRIMEVDVAVGNLAKGKPAEGGGGADQDDIQNIFKRLNNLESKQAKAIEKITTKVDGIKLKLSRVSVLNARVKHFEEKMEEMQKALNKQSNGAAKQATIAEVKHGGAN